MIEKRRGWMDLPEVHQVQVRLQVHLYAQENEKV